MRVRLLDEHKINCLDVLTCHAKFSTQSKFGWRGCQKFKVVFPFFGGHNISPQSENQNHAPTKKPHPQPGQGFKFAISPRHKSQLTHFLIR